VLHIFFSKWYFDIQHCSIVKCPNLDSGKTYFSFTGFIQILIKYPDGLLVVIDEIVCCPNLLLKAALPYDCNIHVCF